MLRLAANTIPDKVYTFAIALQNSALGQPSPWPIVLEARQGGAGGGAGQRLLPVEEMSVPGGILSPLVIAGFSNKTISQVVCVCAARASSCVLLCVCFVRVHLFVARGV